jgi:putative membrane protein
VIDGRVRAALLFVAGCVTVAAALLPPLEPLADQSFTAHMVQHELFMVVAAPLLVASRPGVVLLRAMPLGARRRIGRVLSTSLWRSMWSAITHPAVAWLVHAAAIWVWHIPSLFDAALEHPIVHGMQHISFLGSGMLFWWTILHPRRRAALGAAILYLFTTAVHTAALGALLATSRTPWYPDYFNGTPPWHLTPLEDQQLAGLLMWIPAGVVYLGVALLTVRRWLRLSGWSATQAARASLAS